MIDVEKELASILAKEIEMEQILFHFGKVAGTTEFSKMYAKLHSDQDFFEECQAKFRSDINQYVLRELDKIAKDNHERRI